MGELLHQRERLRSVSISRVAELLGMDRKTVAKRIAEANLKPCSMRDGYPVYDGRQACEACLLPLASSEESAPFDPRNLKPLDRRAWYQSERERMAVESEARQLIPAIEVQAEFAEMARTFVQFLDTLGDQLERDIGLTPEQVDAMNASIAKQRAELYADTVSEIDDEAASA